MFCVKCGRQITSGSVCKNCGYDYVAEKYVNINVGKSEKVSKLKGTLINDEKKDIEKEGIKKNTYYGEAKKKLTKSDIYKSIVASILLFCLAGIVFSFCFGSLRYKLGISDNDSKVEKLMDYVENNQYQEALNYYESNILGLQNEDRLNDKIAKKIEVKYDTIIDLYNNSSVTDSEMEALVNMVEMLTYDEESRSFISNYRNLCDSKKCYNEAEEYYNMGDYENAISKYMFVSQTDLNYSDVKEKIKNSIISIGTVTGDFTTAYNVLDIVYAEQISAEEYDAIKSSITNSIVALANEEINSKLEDNQYKEAETYIKELVNEYPEIIQLQEISDSLENNYVSKMKLKASEYFNANEYGKAAGTIEIAISQIGTENAELNNLYNEYKSYLDVYLDEMTTFNGRYDKSNGYELRDNTGFEHYHGCSFYETAEFLLNGRYSTMSGTIALTEASKSTKSTGWYEIYGDGKLLYTSEKMTGGILPISFNIEISNVNMLKIVSKGVTSDWSDTKEVVFYDTILKK